MDAGDLRWVTVNAMKSAFMPFDERLALIDGWSSRGMRSSGFPPDIAPVR